MGEAIDPGARPGGLIPVDTSQEPSAESLILDQPEPEPSASRPEPGTGPATTPKPATKWRGVHTTPPSSLELTGLIQLKVGSDFTNYPR